MTKPHEYRRSSRIINKRIIVQGTLILTSPAVFSNGDSEGPMDMMILRDSVSDHALLPGSSLAGALRAYLELHNDNEENLATLLFGAEKKSKDNQQDRGEQSRLVIWDALSSKVPTIETRDGVRINPQTGVADDKAKYDLELMATNTCFDLCLELVIDKDADEPMLKQALSCILNALKDGHITLGMKKTRGFGKVMVSEYHVQEFDMNNSTGLENWLKWQFKPLKTGQKLNKLPHWLTAKPALPPQVRCTLTATFKLDSSLLIRADASHVRGSKKDNPEYLLLRIDAAHLTSRKDKKMVPVIPGTSWAGVLRHRAERICNTLDITSCTIINDLFGWTPEPEAKHHKGQQSRVVVEDSQINQPTKLDWIQNRIAIDRFTGGAYHGALFREQPVWPTQETTVTLELQIKPLAGKPVTDAEVGLLLLLLKDLWTGDLAVGGERSIGRGRLQGVEACLSYGEQTWEIKQTAQNIQVTALSKPSEAPPQSNKQNKKNKQSKQGKQKLKPAAFSQSKQQSYNDLQHFVDSLKQHRNPQAQNSQEVSS